MVEPIKIGENAGVIDTLMAAGRYVLVVVGAVPALLTLLGSKNFSGVVAYFQGADGTALLAAVGALAAMGYGLFKTHKRGAQVVSVASNSRVPNSVASLK